MSTRSQPHPCAQALFSLKHSPLPLKSFSSIFPRPRSRSRVAHAALQLTGIVGDVGALGAEGIEHGTGSVDVAHGQQVLTGTLLGGDSRQENEDQTKKDQSRKGEIDERADGRQQTLQ